MRITVLVLNVWFEHRDHYGPWTRDRSLQTRDENQRYAENVRAAQTITKQQGTRGCLHQVTTSHMLFFAFGVWEDASSSPVAAMPVMISAALSGIAAAPPFKSAHHVWSWRRQLRGAGRTLNVATHRFRLMFHPGAAHFLPSLALL